MGRSAFAAFEVCIRAKQVLITRFELPDEDIEIKIVGLRPGEKLFEELLTKEERSRGLEDNGHEKIFTARVEEVDGGKLEKDIKELEGLAKKMDMEGTRGCAKLSA